MTDNIKTKPTFSKSLLKSLIASILFSSALATSTAAMADSCSCSDDSSVTTVSIEESNEAHPNQLTLTPSNAYYQLKDQNGQILQDRLYDVTPYPDGKMIAKRDGKYGLISTQGELIFDFQYDGIEILPADLYLLYRQQGAGYSSALVRSANDWLYPASGKFVANTGIEQLYYDQTNSIGYYRTSDNGKSGLINDQKQTLIANQYDEVELLDTCPNERLFMTVKVGDKTGLIDQNQKFVVPLASNQMIENFNEDEQIFKVSKYANEAYSTEPTIISEKLIKGSGQTLIQSDSTIQSVVSNLYQYSYDKKYGLINSKAEIIAPASFDYISSDSYSAPVVTRNDKQGILRKDDNTQQLLVSKYYDQLQEAYTEDKTLEQLRMPDSEEEAYSEEASAEAAYDEAAYDEAAYAEDEIIIDATEEVIVDAEDSELELDENYNFQDTLFIAKNNNRYGLIDSYDQVRIPFLYDDIQLSSNILLVKKDQKYGLLTTHNETVVGVLYDNIETMYDAEDDLIYKITQGEQQGIINSVGEKLYPLSPYQIVDDSENGISRYTIIGSNGKYGLLNDNASSILIPAEYEKIDRELSNKNIIAQKNGKKVLIDTFGQVIPIDLSPYTEISDLDATDNLLVTDNSARQGVINSNGKVLIAPKYDAVTAIPLGYYTDDSKTYYMIELDGYYGLLDTSGKTIIRPKYTDMSPLYYSAYLRVSDSKFDSETIKVGLVDDKGRVVKSFKYDAIEENYYGEDEQIALIMMIDNDVEIYDTKLKLIKKMSLEEYQQSS